MEQNNKKEQWVTEVMNSTAGMRKAQPGKDLYAHVMNNLDGPQAARIVRLPVRQWAAAAIVLLALNVGSVLYFTTRGSGTAPTSANPLAAEMQQGSTYNY